MHVINLATAALLLLSTAVAVTVPVPMPRPKPELPKDTYVAPLPPPPKVTVGEQPPVVAIKVEPQTAQQKVDVIEMRLEKAADDIEELTRIVERQQKAKARGD